MQRAIPTWMIDVLGVALSAGAVVVTTLFTPEIATGVYAGWGVGAVLVAVLCRIPAHRWAPYLVVAGLSSWHAVTECSWLGAARLLVVAVDILAIAAAASVLRRMSGVDFRSNRTVWIMLSVGFGAAALRCGAIIVASLIQPLVDPPLSSLVWLTAGATIVSLTTVTPALLLMALEFPLPRPDAAWVRRVLPPFIATAIACALAYSPLTDDLGSAEFLPVPIVVYGLLRLRRLEAALLLTFSVGWVLVATSLGRGPFNIDAGTRTQPLDHMISALAFCLAAALVSWFIISQRSAAAAAENELRATFDLASTPLEVQTFAGRRLRANRATLDFFEVSAEQLERYHWTELSHPDDVPEDLRLTNAMREGLLPQYRLLKRYRLPNGKQKWGQLSVTRANDVVSGEDFVVTQIIDVTAEKAAVERLDFELDHDAVTGLLSRRGIANVLDLELASAQAADDRIAALFVDLSEFVFINTTLGHEAADEAMEMVAHAVADTLPAGASIGRFDGFLLLVVAPLTGEREPEIEDLCLPILQAAATELTVRGHRIIREARIGASISTDASTSTTLLREANAALLQGKQELERRWWRYEHDAGADETARLAVEHQLREALERDELVLFLQPQVRLSNGVPTGYEALVRWQHPVRGLLAPVDFLPEAERAGLMGAIGRRMLESVCTVLRDRPDLSGRISVNVSPLELKSRGWFERFRETVGEFGVDFHRLVIEFTETAALRLSADMVEALRELRDLGVGIHVDDFGTGYSSIALLRELPVTGLKLDRSFVDDLANPDGSAVALATGLAGLAKGLDLETIAEGIETREQAALLRGIGWEIGQGDLYGRAAAVPTAR